MNKKIHFQYLIGKKNGFELKELRDTMVQILRPKKVSKH